MSQQQDLDKIWQQLLSSVFGEKEMGALAKKGTSI